MTKSKKTKLPYQIVIVDILIFILIMLTNVFATAHTFFNGGSLTNDINSLGVYLPLFVTIFVLAGFYLFVEYKFNHLKLNKILIAIAIVIACSNFISVMILPNHLLLPNDQTLDINPFDRVQCILWGFVFPFIPIILIYLFPRRVNSRGYINFILKCMIIFTAILILASFIIDKDTYVLVFNGGFFDLKYENGIKSFMGHHNYFAFMMLLGMMAAILLQIRKENWKWGLYLIPLTILVWLSTSKICIVLALLIDLIHIIVRTVIVAKKSRDNLIITILISSFLVLLIVYGSVMMSYSTDGILFKIKSSIIRSFENAATTFASRSAIWDCSFRILNTNYWSYIFGFGGLIYANALHIVYANNPGISETYVIRSHNGFVQILSEGGVILLLVYIALYAYLIRAAIKIYKKQPVATFMSLLFIVVSIIRGVFESSFLFGRDMDVIMTMVIAFPVLNEYYLCYKKEQDTREELVKQAKTIKNVSFKSKILSLNKKFLMLEAKYIAYDLNSKIRL